MELSEGKDFGLGLDLRLRVVSGLASAFAVASSSASVEAATGRALGCGCLPAGLLHTRLALDSVSVVLGVSVSAGVVVDPDGDDGDLFGFDAVGDLFGFDAVGDFFGFEGVGDLFGFEAVGDLCGFKAAELDLEDKRFSFCSFALDPLRASLPLRLAGLPGFLFPSGCSSALLRTAN